MKANKTFFRQVKAERTSHPQTCAIIEFLQWKENNTSEQLNLCKEMKHTGNGNNN